MRSVSLLVYKAVDGAIEVGAACYPSPPPSFDLPQGYSNTPLMFTRTRTKCISVKHSHRPTLSRRKSRGTITQTG